MGGAAMKETGAAVTAASVSFDRAVFEAPTQRCKSVRLPVCLQHSHLPV